MAASCTAENSHSLDVCAAAPPPRIPHRYEVAVPGGAGEQLSEWQGPADVPTTHFRCTVIVYVCLYVGMYVSMSLWSVGV